MTDPTFTFTQDGDEGFSVVVNFELQGGREATQAEIDRLADAILERVPAVEIVTERRVEADRTGRATVYQVRVELPSPARREELTELVDAWARDCIAERSVLTP